jgi:hypothetical protein
MIKRTVERHNKRSDNLGLPKITKRIHSHLFRYHAQTRDELDGVPRSIMCKQRGWKTDSKQPERYARIVTKDVDSYYAKKFGISGGEIKEQPKPGRCPRCKEVTCGQGSKYIVRTARNVGLSLSRPIAGNAGLHAPSDGMFRVEHLSTDRIIYR